MGYLKGFPDLDSEGIITIAQADTSTNQITTLIRHENPQVEEGWITLAFRAVGNASDVITPYCAFYFGGTFNDHSHNLTGTPPGFTLTDDDGNTTVAPAASPGNRFIVALNRQAWWQLNEGIRIRFKKTGTNAACTISWRVLQR